MGTRVLIAEDEPSIVASLEFLMRRCGYEARHAPDGQKALEMMGEFRPHLVILDLMLPQKSGLEVCRAIREHPEWRAARVMMLTARGGMNEVARGLAAGADDYLAKPFSTHDLVERVKLLLEGGGVAAAPTGRIE